MAMQILLSISNPIQGGHQSLVSSETTSLLLSCLVHSSVSEKLKNGDRRRGMERLPSCRVHPNDVRKHELETHAYAHPKRKKRPTNGMLLIVWLTLNYAGAALLDFQSAS